MGSRGQKTDYPTLKPKAEIKRERERKNKIFCKKAIDMDGKRFISSKTIFSFNGVLGKTK